MKEFNQNQFFAYLAHGLGIFAGILSGIFLYMKFLLAGYSFALALAVAAFLGLLLIVASEITGAFLSNLLALCLQKELRAKDIKSEIVYNAVGTVCALGLLVFVAIFSVRNFVAVQTLGRERQAININQLPKVQPLYETVKNLEDALKNAQNELEAAQLRFQSYQGTNQYRNQGKANQAATLAQERKNKLEFELSQARATYLSAYKLEVAKGTNMLDRADNGSDSKVYMAGIVEAGAPWIILLGILLSALSSPTQVYLCEFKVKRREQAEKAASTPIPARSIPLVAPKGEFVEQAKTEIVAKPAQEMLRQFLPKPEAEKTLEDLIVDACLDRMPASDICNYFPDIQPHQARRLVSRTLARAKAVYNGKHRNPVILSKFALQAIERSTSVKRVGFQGNDTPALPSQDLAQAVLKVLNGELSRSHLKEAFGLENFQTHRIFQRIKRCQDKMLAESPHLQLADAQKAAVNSVVERLQCLESERQSYIYFIKELSSGYFKIGITSNDPLQRLAALQTSTPNKLSLFGVVDKGTLELEKELHQQLAEHRLSGEWFSISDDEAKILLESKNGQVL